MTVSAERDTRFLPDFCEQGNLLRTVLIAELLAIVLAAAHSVDWFARLRALALLSLLIQWIAVVDIALLCMLQRYLNRLDERTAALVAFLGLQAVTLTFTLVAHSIAVSTGLPAGQRPLGTMLAEHGVISAIVTAIGLRYFYVTAHWRRQVEAEAQARVQALQARIRPHFLFNSMNTIASLTRSSPSQAESAVEDLAELFRASLADRSFLTLGEELELVASYLRIEGQRLGARLAVQWHVEPGASEAAVPALTLQPLVENAVYHGIEQVAGGGTLSIDVRRVDADVEIRVDNPVPDAPARSAGHRMAQDNVRERLALAFGGRARLDTETSDGWYTARLRIPVEDVEP